jgi:DNA polymerase type B, organellar and viral
LYNLRLQYPKTNPLNYVAKIILNSVFGKFGMIDSFPEITIFKDIELYQEFEKDNAENILNVIELGERLLVIHRALSKDIDTLLDSTKETHNVNIAIASAITAYARIHMSQFKNNPEFNLFYTDTDSIYIDKELSEDLVSNTELGKMKLENKLEKAIFISPKVYCLQTENNKVIYKVKGLSHDVELTMSDFEDLLIKNTFIKKFQTK